MTSWACEGCGRSYSAGDPDFITRHVAECEYVDGTGQEIDVVVKWSVTSWHVVTVRSSDLAEVTGGLPFAQLTGRILDPDDDDPDAGLPGYLDELAADFGPAETDRWEVSAIYDARRDKPRQAGRSRSAPVPPRHGRP